MGSGITKIFSTIEGSLIAAIIAFVVLITYVIAVKFYGIGFGEIFYKIYKFIVKKISSFIRNKELQYYRDLAIGKINEKTLRVRVYRFLNNLIIDLDLKSKGFTPYSFLFFVVTGSFVLSTLGTKIIFNSWVIGFILFPVVLIGVIAILFTSANIRHDARIEAVIEAQNIISNNIKDGVVVAIRNTIDLLPSLVRPAFIDFLDNIDHKNYHVKTALLELNDNLGSVATDFIRKCIVFEMEEEHGIAGMFQDIIEMNNIKTDLRNEMKHRFEEIVTDFVVSFVLIVLFLGGVLYVYENVRKFYLHNIIGQVILGLDFIIVVSVFVLITILRAKEL